MKTASKPAGLPIFADSGDSFVRRLGTLEPARLDLAWPAGFPCGIVFRMDAATSGAIALADSPAELAWLRTWLAEGRFTRTWRFLTATDPGWEAAACDLPIAYARDGAALVVLRTRPGVPHRGAWVPARTAFRRLGPSAGGWLIEATATAVFQHQIRAHAAHVGAPLWGDADYGGAAGSPLRLHHVGMVGPGGLATTAVETPAWATV